MPCVCPTWVKESTLGVQCAFQADRGLVGTIAEEEHEP